MQYIIDAKGKKLGRLASEIAVILQGKKSAKYNPRLIGDDSVLVKNASQVETTGRKMKQRIYYRHTTQIGHLKSQSLGSLWEKRGPAYVLKKVVAHMLPKNKLAEKRLKKLSIEE